MRISSHFYFKNKAKYINLENLEGFEENIYIKDNDTLVMNVTGVTERDLEYYISLKEMIDSQWLSGASDLEIIKEYIIQND